MSETLSAVVAGSKGFVDAVQGHLKLRFGAAPRVASDPAEALRACADRGGLLVLEYAGSPWLEAVKSLRGACGDAALSIVAAVPLAQAADVRPLQRAGVDEVVSWQGRVDPVIWAVDRIVGRQSARPAGPLPVPEAPDEGVLETGFEVREVPTQPGSTDSRADPEVPVLSKAAAAVSSEPRPPVLPVAPAPAVPWPDAVPSAPAAEALLLAVSAGRGAGDADQLAAAERVVATASELERAALGGADVPVEPALLRTIAGLRLRLDLALSTVPAAGGAADQPAAQQLLAEVDGVLEQLKALVAAAPAGVAPALEPMRLAIVDGGVKLAGALSGLVPQGAPKAATPVVEQKPATRVISNVSAAESGEAAPARKGIWIAFAIVVACTLAYHGWRVGVRHALTPTVSLPGAPANTFVVARSSSQLLKTLAGSTVDPSELEKFRAQEQAKGNVVRSVGPGVWSVEPAPTPRARP